MYHPLKPLGKKVGPFHDVKFEHGTSFVAKLHSLALWQDKVKQSATDQLEVTILNSYGYLEFTPKKLEDADWTTLDGPDALDAIGDRIFRDGEVVMIRSKEAHDELVASQLRLKQKEEAEAAAAAAKN